MAKQLLADAGYLDGVSDTLQVGDIGEIPDGRDCAAELRRSRYQPRGQRHPELRLLRRVLVHRRQLGCSARDRRSRRPLWRSAGIGIVDYGHRPVPDIYLTRALQTDGDWNSSNYADADYDAMVVAYQGAADVEGQKAAIGQIQQKLHEDGPAMYPYFYNYLGGHDSSVSGVEVTALGHIQLQNAQGLIL